MLGYFYPPLWLMLVYYAGMVFYSGVLVAPWLYVFGMKFKKRWVKILALVWYALGLTVFFMVYREGHLKLYPY